MEEDDYWLHMYVMLSRATSLHDILLARAPDASFLLRGPPPDLARRLELFRASVTKCHQRAQKTAKEFGFESFFH